MPWQRPLDAKTRATTTTALAVSCRLVALAGGDRPCICWMALGSLVINVVRKAMMRLSLAAHLNGQVPDRLVLIMFACWCCWRVLFAASLVPIRSIVVTCADSCTVWREASKKSSPSRAGRLTFSIKMRNPPTLSIHPLGRSPKTSALESNDHQPEGEKKRNNNQASCTVQSALAYSKEAPRFVFAPLLRNPTRIASCRKSPRRNRLSFLVPPPTTFASAAQKLRQLQIFLAR